MPKYECRDHRVLGGKDKITVLCIIIETLKRENPVACVPKRGIHTRYVTRCSHAFPPPGRDGEHIHSVLTTENCAVV